MCTVLTASHYNRFVSGVHYNTRPPLLQQEHLLLRSFLRSCPSVEKRLYILHIREHILAFARIAQERRRVEHGADCVFSFFVEDSVFLRDPEIGLYQTHCRNPSEAHYDPRLYQSYLLTQESYAFVFLLRLRIAVMRRTAFQNVRYIHVLPVDPDRAQLFIEEFSRRADKRDP